MSGSYTSSPPCTFISVLWDLFLLERVRFYKFRTCFNLQVRCLLIYTLHSPQSCVIAHTNMSSYADTNYLQVNCIDYTRVYLKPGDTANEIRDGIQFRFSYRPTRVAIQAALNHKLHFLATLLTSLASMFSHC
jgi:hypothetical protein